LVRLREVGIAVIIGVILLSGFIVVLLTRGEDSQPGASTGTPFTATTADDIAIEELARRSIETLPRGEWPSLYDSFTPEFQQRCPREEFVAAGEAGAREQGDKLPLLRFVRLEDVTIDGEAATATIVGEVTGESEYRIRGAFQKVEGGWKLAPAAGTSGCSAFDRVLPS
jgi:hypothetical protein